MAGLNRDLRATAVGSGVDLRTYPVNAAETFKKGDILTFTTTGKLTQTLSAAANFGATPYIVGIAMQDATDDNGAVRPSISVLEVKPGTRMWLPIYHGTPASAVFTPGTSNSQSAAGFELRYNSATTGFAVDVSATTNKAVRILDVDPADYPGWPTYNGAGTTQYPHVLVEFIAGACLLTGAR